MHSSGIWTAAIEPDVYAEPSARRAAAAPAQAFTAGIFAGILVAAIAGQLWLARNLEVLSLFILDGVDLRSLSNLAISPLWRYGVPTLFTVVLMVMLGLRVRATAVWAVVAAAAVATLVLTHVWAFAALD